MKKPEPEAWIGIDRAGPCGIMNWNGKPPGPPSPPSPNGPRIWPNCTAGLAFACSSTLIDTTAGATRATISAKLLGAVWTAAAPGGLTAPPGPCAWAKYPPAPARIIAAAPMTAPLDRELIFSLDIKISCFRLGEALRPFKPQPTLGAHPAVGCMRPAAALNIAATYARNIAHPGCARRPERELVKQSRAAVQVRTA